MTTAEAEREMRRMRAAGYGFATIAATLNRRGVPTARGGRWYPSTIAKVLHSLELDAEAASAA